MPQTVYGLDAASMKRTVAAVKKIEKFPTDLIGAIPGKNLPSIAFWAKITDADTSTPTKFSWQKMFPDDMAVLTAVDGATGDHNAYEVNGLPCSTDTIVWLTYAGAGNYLFATPAEVFPVKVSVDGGSAGSMQAGTDCTFTYTVYAEDGTTQLGTTKTPDTTRYSACKYNHPGDKSPGIAYYDGTTLHLYSVAQERPSGAVVTNITDIQVNDSSHTIQVKTQDQLVLDNKDKTDWTTIYTGSVCS